MADFDEVNSNQDMMGTATDYSIHDESSASLHDMTYRGRTLLEKDRDDSSRVAAKTRAGQELTDMSHKGITDYLRKP